MLWEYLKEEDISLWMDLANMAQLTFPGYYEQMQDNDIGVAQKQKETIVVKDQGRMLGILLFSKQAKELCFIFVHPQHRRRHIGQLLFHGMCASFHHGEQIQVLSIPYDDINCITARRFYSYLGFKEGPLVERSHQPFPLFTYTISNQNNTILLPCIQRSLSKINQLCEVWEASVRATHTFLNEEDIVQLRGVIPYALMHVPHLYTVNDSHQHIIGFMGINQQEIVMLFLHPEKRGQGIGQRCITFALDHHQCNRVDVNEQNPAARTFYEKMGFHRKDRSPLDDAGRPFPILHMKLEETR